MWRRSTNLVIAIACILVFASVGHACPTCKQAIAEGGHHDQVVRGYFWSIIFMMSMPFLILGALGTYFYLLVRSARAAAGSATNVPT